MAEKWSKLLITLISSIMKVEEIKVKNMQKNMAIGQDAHQLKK